MINKLILGDRNIVEQDSDIKWPCFTHTLECKLDQLRYINSCWRLYPYKNSTNRIIFKLNWLLNPWNFDLCTPLHEYAAPYIEWKYENWKSSNICKDQISLLWVHHKKKQFKIATIAGSYIVEPESSRIFLSWSVKNKMFWKYKDWFIFKIYFIHGEHFKVMLNFANLEEGIQKIICSFITKDTDCYAVIKINDICKIELKEIYLTQYFSDFNNVSEYEITLNDRKSEKDCIMKILNKLPRKLQLQINIDLKSEWVWDDSEFFELMTEFNSFRLCLFFVSDLPKDESKLIINDIYKRMFMLSYNGSLSSENIVKLYGRLLTKTRFL